MNKFERIEESRVKRTVVRVVNKTPKKKPKKKDFFFFPAKSFTKSARSWCLVKKFDDGRTQIIEHCRNKRTADELAGKMRDEMTDKECGEDWNYQAEKI